MAAIYPASGVGCKHGQVQPSDGDLVWLARAGEAEAWAALLGRHGAAMHAVAVSVLGSGADAEDAVQDACLVALVGVHRLRDPARVRSWLTGICRNVARERLRRAPTRSSDFVHYPDAAPDPEQVLVAAGLREWVWQALHELSEAHREVVVLRYFATANTYSAIAATLGIPVGTVRSRLHDARAALRQALPALESSAHADHARLEREREALFAGIVDEYNRGVDLALLRDLLTSDARLTAAGNDEVWRGATRIVGSLEQDVQAGVTMQLMRVVASADMSVVEAAFRNPHDDPHHCPPLTTQVYRHRGDGVHSLHLHYSAD